MAKKHLKVILIFLACSLFVVVLFFSLHKEPFLVKDTESRANIEVGSETNIQTKNEIDSDNDGLKDWEETLWNTDSKNADTDGDGTSDGDEVRAGRNPLVPGPKDLISSQNTAATQADKAKAGADLSPTDKLGRELFGQYLALKQSGATFDDAKIETFVTEIVKNNEEDIPYRIYTQNDLTASASEDSESVKNYGNSVGNILISHPSQSENELVIFGRYSDTGDPKELEALKPIIDSYKTILNEELTLPVPKDALLTHLEFVNALSFVLGSLQNMNTVKTNDPLVVLISVNHHVEAAQKLADSIASLQTYFNDKGVKFEATEAGYVFTNRI